jgi:hypothetical protein
MEPVNALLITGIYYKIFQGVNAIHGLMSL